MYHMEHHYLTSPALVDHMDYLDHLDSHVVHTYSYPYHVDHTYSYPYHTYSYPYHVDHVDHIEDIHHIDYYSKVYDDDMLICKDCRRKLYQQV